MYSKGYLQQQLDKDNFCNDGNMSFEKIRIKMVRDLENQLALMLEILQWHS